MGPHTRKFLKRVKRKTKGEPFNLVDVLNGETFNNRWERLDTRNLLLEHTETVDFSPDGTPLRLVVGV